MTLKITAEFLATLAWVLQSVIVLMWFTMKQRIDPEILITLAWVMQSLGLSAMKVIEATKGR